jgi:hypothetical protein
MLVPEGWTFVPGAEENPVIVAPRGRLPPSLAIAVLNATAPLQLQMVRLFLNPTPDLGRCFVQAGLSGSYTCLGPYYERFEPRMSAVGASRVFLTTRRQQGVRLLDVRTHPLRWLPRLEGRLLPSRQGARSVRPPVRVQLGREPDQREGLTFAGGALFQVTEGLRPDRHA